MKPKSKLARTPAPLRSPTSLDRAPWPTLGWAAGGIALLIASFVWAYFPTLAELAHAWNVEPDYSHGYFVVPVALWFLWMRRADMPQLVPSVPVGLLMIFAALSLHVYASVYYLNALSGWSIPLWCGGLCWLLGGRRFFMWCLPALGFLVFMVPLPYRIETALRFPLQRVATEVSCWTLQSLGQPALAEGDVIQINNIQLEVAQACSGLRIFVSIMALAYACSVLIRRPWWMKALLWLAALPIAVIANAMRVAFVGLLLPHAATATARGWMHDIAGWIVVPMAACLMGLFAWYLGRLFVEFRPLSGKEMLQNR
ncbi:MAG: exosortase/archaeosortase family protein [Planctomycetia bacterium]|nr:exosortase/archaeosortase family protein [Planctomycetia bacterium]